ncbi:hypothetical protein, conserved [Leishmania donovani]|uniref:Uncharacterized protein n=1 Tax=Leishmania donovani TaxID=5661 RepID=A0A3S7X8U8_LEIDO|nr:hypothetical protein, conserved [Leishmania donovani]AYU82858.1 hypothetical protein LdCL_350010800 [Leishmania donovani]TPP44340.1 hypothetical protein CGC21_5865 [Leishmania donovani]CBZ37965.1 hypothetical protein, conserved [Leishmania donovani]
MSHPAILSELTIARGVHASCLPVSIPHQLPALEVFDQTPVPQRVSTSCTLLRVHRCSAYEPAREQDRCADTAAAVVVAEWSSCPELVAPPAGGDEASLFLYRYGGGPGASFAAPPLNFACFTQWVVLRVRCVSHSASAVELESYRSGGDACQEWMEWRLRLGTVLYASDWQFLVSQQERKEATTGSSFDLGVTGAKREQTVRADMDALSTFFPALHHGRYYATAQAFVHHCRHSDEHLVWCEKDPLLSVEWAGVEEAQSEVPARHDAGSPTDKECGNAGVECASVVSPENADMWRSHVGGSRKRRRRWLSQRGRECPSAQARHDAVSALRHHRSTQATTLSCSVGTTAATSTVALDSICCAYLLGLKHQDCQSASGEGSVSTAAEAPAGIQNQCSESPNVPQPPLYTSSKHVEEVLQSSSYARWYLALRPACRSAFYVPRSGRAAAAATVEVRDAEKAASDEVRRRALQEVLLHGIAVSLALWFCTGSSSTCDSVELCALQQREPSRTPFTTSTRDATVLVAALLRDWWNQLSQEAAEFFSLSAATARAGPQRRWNRCCIAHQVWASLQMWDCASSLRPVAAVAPPPASVAHLCVACAIVVARVHRSQERMLWWNVCAPTVKPSQACADEAADCNASAGARSTRSGTNGGAADGSGRAPSIDGVASSMRCTSASCRLPRMSVKESRRWCDDYRACMDLVLQLLFAEQQQHWAP